ncbi:hypothetical protein FVEG_11262 [Fusarium verticillioides 7600]|uniref:Uncharacterized protein n=1 Tax=Gibberella moniliformis (strain M3125 / FGSC 7600) TaxID=334819 RepID=W7MM20_GIBM7|nr:hypothetical protein FVEG_11262 [Fusarium verticillioides 7600]EWG52528.1 hypothetical protein FVEG_11262 [Fusarium verticillioides 7600]
MASQNPQTPTTSTDERKPAKCHGLMLAPYIYDTDSVQEHLLCRAEASNTAPESAGNMSEIVGQESHGELEVQDLDAMMKEPSSPKSRL